MIIFRQSLYTKWDDTDELKRAKDSDILAEEEKKPKTSKKKILRKTAIAAAASGALGGLAGLAAGGLGKGRSKAKAAALGKTGLALGALIGGGTRAAIETAKRDREIDANEFYNDRLEYAKLQALRRERADWKKNMTQRDGYSY